jgi:WD40 repeat protein
MEIYESALVWIPQNSLMRKTYTAEVSKVPKVILGLSDSWSPAELIMQNGSRVECVAFSQDGSQVVSGSEDKIVRIWNVMTGEVEAELKGHTACLMSVAFSQDGSRVFSGSDDNMFRIWNVMTGEVEAELKGPRNSTNPVAFSPEGSRVVSGAFDGTVRIWNVATGEEAELKGHTTWVNSVAFSPAAESSLDHTTKRPNLECVTGKVEAELKGHTDVRSVAFRRTKSSLDRSEFGM